MSLTFDMSLFEIWVALGNGATLVGLPREALLDADVMAHQVRARRLDAVVLPTAVLHATVARRPEAFAGLDLVVFGGEAADPVALRTVLEAGRPRRLVNGYGPSEASVFVTTHDVGQVERGAGAVPIGRPGVGAVVTVLDPRGELVPAGAIGELWVSGPAVAHGYHRRPAESARSSSTTRRGSDRRTARVTWCGGPPAACSSTCVAATGR